MPTALMTASHRWARILSLATGVTMLLIGGAIICFVLSPSFVTSSRLGMFSVTVAMVAALWLILPGFTYLLVTLFMRPGRLWPMGVLLAITELHVFAGGVCLWEWVWGQDVSLWFTWVCIVYTAVPLVIVVLLIRSIRGGRLTRARV